MSLMIGGISSAGWTAIGVIGFIILVALAFWPARVARRKGHSWLLFFIFSLFLFIALIVAYLMPNRRRRERREARRVERRDGV